MEEQDGVLQHNAQKGLQTGMKKDRRRDGEVVRDHLINGFQPLARDFGFHP